MGKVVKRCKPKRWNTEVLLTNQQKRWGKRGDKRARDNFATLPYIFPLQAKTLSELQQRYSQRQFVLKACTHTNPVLFVFFYFFFFRLLAGNPLRFRARPRGGWRGMLKLTRRALDVLVSMLRNRLTRTNLWILLKQKAFLELLNADVRSILLSLCKTARWCIRFAVE